MCRASSTSRLPPASILPVLPHIEPPQLGDINCQWPERRAAHRPVVDQSQQKSSAGRCVVTGKAGQPFVEAWKTEVDGEPVRLFHEQLPCQFDALGSVSLNDPHEIRFREKSAAGRQFNELQPVYDSRVFGVGVQWACRTALWHPTLGSRRPIQNATIRGQRLDTHSWRPFCTQIPSPIMCR